MQLGHLNSFIRAILTTENMDICLGIQKHTLTRTNTHWRQNTDKNKMQMYLRFFLDVDTIHMEPLMTTICLMGRYHV